MLLEKIKADSLAARKSGDKLKASVLVTLYSEAAPSGNAEEPTDEKVLTVIKKFVKNLETFSTETTESELAILRSYLPQQLTEAQLRKYIDTFVVAGLPNLGAIIAELKLHYPNQFDGKLAAQLIKERMNER
jgi:uncharacterized protein YqeY